MFIILENSFAEHCAVICFNQIISRSELLNKQEKKSQYKIKFIYLWILLLWIAIWVNWNRNIFFSFLFLIVSVVFLIKKHVSLLFYMFSSLLLKKYHSNPVSHNNIEIFFAVVHVHSYIHIPQNKYFIQHTSNTRCLFCHIISDLRFISRIISARHASRGLRLGFCLLYGINFDCMEHHYEKLYVSFQNKWCK